MNENTLQLALAVIGGLGTIGGGIMWIFKMLQGIVDKANESRAISDKRHSELVEKVMSESKEREDKLLIQLEKYNESLSKIANTYEKDSNELKNDVSHMKQEITLIKQAIHMQPV